MLRWSMINRNGGELDIITLVRWVDKTLYPSLTKTNICLELQPFGHLTLGPWITKQTLTTHT
jgi:hypothetical protein